MTLVTGAGVWLYLLQLRPNRRGSCTACDYKLFVKQAHIYQGLLLLCPLSIVTQSTSEINEQASAVWPNVQPLEDKESISESTAAVVFHTDMQRQKSHTCPPKIEEGKSPAQPD